MPEIPAPYRLTSHFSALRDPRVARTRRHKFLDIILLSIIAMLSGADNFVEIEQFGKAHLPWLQTFLELPAGIPSHDTIARLFARLNPQAFSDALSAWIQDVHTKADEKKAQEANPENDAQKHDAQKPPAKPPRKVYAIDGKKLCASFDRVSGQNALHLVSLYCTQYHMVLTQQKVDEKSHEQTAIAPLLNQFDVAGAILTLDAMHTQKETTQVIRSHEADYVIGLKSNQPRLLNDVTGFFDRADQRGFWTDEGEPLPHGHLKCRNLDHGRYETRDYVYAPAPAWLEGMDEWQDLRTIIRVDRTRLIGDVVTSERSYYISSLPVTSKQIPHVIRSHWRIENSLHWILDIAYDEDHCRAHKGHEAQNLASIRRFTLSVLKADTTTKVGIKAKRKTAGWDHNYRAQLIDTLTI